MPGADRAARGDRQRAFAAVKHGWLPGAGLACSGGHDSTALLLLATEARDAGQLVPFVALHVDHALRPDSADDAEFVAELCRRLAAPFVSVTLAWDQPPRHVSEDTLRQRRYAALARLTTRLSLTGVVTAHTRDDQVETVLMRLFSGAAPAATAGMEPVTLLDTSAAHRDLWVARPLLGIPRRALDAVLAAHGVTPREDATNRDTRYLRNALRHEVLPRVAATFPGYEDALLRSVELARRDDEYLHHLATETGRQVVRRAGDTHVVERVWLRQAPPALATRVLMSALIQAGAFRDWRNLSFERIEALRVAASGRTGARIEISGGVWARVASTEIVLCKRAHSEGETVGTAAEEP